MLLFAWMLLKNIQGMPGIILTGITNILSINLFCDSIAELNFYICFPTKKRL